MKLIIFERLSLEKGIEYSRDHLRRKVATGEFPKPISVSSRRIAWIEAEIDEWIERRAAQRPAA
jgi:prophage regulatory protein